MKYKKEILEELEELSPFFAKMKEQEPSDGFKLPENYFEFLTDSVMEQVKLEPNPISQKVIKKKNAWYHFFFQPQLLGATGLALMLIIALFFYNQPKASTLEVGLSSQEAAIYISNHLDEFDTALFLKDDLFLEIGEVEFETEELNQYLEEVIDELDDATLEQLL